MKVVLPDSSELELPDGASGLDAARAIGPKLAEQAVLVRVNGSTRDLRLPLGRRADPVSDDAGHAGRRRARGFAAFGRAPARGGRATAPSGVKIAIGPAIADGFYYDFEFPEPIAEDDLAAIEEEMRRELAEGRSWEREDISREEAVARFEGEDQPQGRARPGSRRCDLSLHPGRLHRSLPWPAPAGLLPIGALKLTGLAGAYWRGDEKNTQLTRIYGRRSSPRPISTRISSASSGRGRVTTAGWAGISTCSICRSTPRARAVLASEGHGDLERARGSSQGGESEAATSR